MDSRKKVVLVILIASVLCLPLFSREQTKHFLINGGLGVDFVFGPKADGKGSFSVNRGFHAGIDYLRDGVAGFVIEYDYCKSPFQFGAGTWDSIRKAFMDYKLSYSSHTVRLGTIGVVRFYEDSKTLHEVYNPIGGYYLVYQQVDFSQEKGDSIVHYSSRHLGIGGMIGVLIKVFDGLLYLDSRVYIEGVYFYRSFSYSLQNWNQFDNEIALMPVNPSFSIGARIGITCLL